uniref:Uncharacterized protein n=1 Tax=Meloidogyne hapla TaxID=6305 RepID=A0A1I8BTN3_MELHA
MKLYTSSDNQLLNPYDIYHDCEQTNRTIPSKNRIKRSSSLLNKLERSDLNLFRLRYGTIPCTDGRKTI